MLFAKRTEHLEPEGAYHMLARAQALEAEGREIIHLEIGQPDNPTFDNVAQAGIRAIQEGHTRYNPPAGLAALREVVAEDAGGESVFDAALAEDGLPAVVPFVARLPQERSAGVTLEETAVVEAELLPYAGAHVPAHVVEDGVAGGAADDDEIELPGQFRSRLRVELLLGAVALDLGNAQGAGGGERRGFQGMRDGGCRRGEREGVCRPRLCRSRV